MAYRPSHIRKQMAANQRKKEVDKLDTGLLSDAAQIKTALEDNEFATPVRVHVLIMDDVADGSLRRKVMKAARDGIRSEKAQGFLIEEPNIVATIAFQLMQGKTLGDLTKEPAATMAKRAAEIFRRDREDYFKDIIADTLEARGIRAETKTIDQVFNTLEASGIAPGDAGFKTEVLDALGRENDYVPSDLTRPVKPTEVKKMVARVVSLNAGRADEIAEELNAAGINSPLVIQNRAIRAALPSTTYHRFLTITKNAISANGGASFLASYGFDDLAGAAMYSVLASEAKPAQVDPETLRAGVEEFFRQNQAGLYKDRIAEVFSARYIEADAKRINAAYTLLTERNVPLNDPDFAEKLVESLPELRIYENYEPLFSTLRDDGLSAPVDDFGGPVPPGLKRSAISLLSDLNVDPSAPDNDWARAALSIAGAGGGFGGGGISFGGLIGGLASPPGLPPVRMRRFEDEFTAGIDADRIRTMAKAYYIYQFDRLGIIDMVEELVARQHSFAYDLGNSPANALLSHYRQVYRIVYPAAEDRRRTFSMVFEEGSRGEAARNLLGAIGEAGIDLQRVNNAGAYFSEDSNRGYSYARFRFVRAGLNLQRFLSDVGGYHMPDLVERCWHQMHFCFSILERPEVQQYWGGRFNSGLWAVVEGLLNEAIGDDREDRRMVYGTQLTDRGRTLAVYGFDLFSWLADNASTLQTAPDAEIDRGLEILQNWLAAFRRPDTVGDWIDDDAFYDGREEAPMDVGDEYAAEAEDAALQDADML